jgi:hypothetical protein
LLGEMAKLNSLIGRRDPGEDFPCWVARLDDARRQLIPSASGADEIRDPYGGRNRQYERVADHINRLVLDLADCAFDPAIADHDTRWREGTFTWRADGRSVDPAAG